MYHREYSVQETAELVGAQSAISDPLAIIRSLAFDSRKLSEPSFTLFFALIGRRNGHDYIGEAYQAGVRNFVVSEDRPFSAEFPGANFLKVDNTLKALHRLCAQHRMQFSYPVIGITGSNGKTIVKEWLYQLLVTDYHIIRSPKSYNSQIGVPLSVWSMTDEYSLALIEAGVSTVGEMDSLAEIIKPTIGVLTTIGEAHSDGFASREEKIREKLRLFADAELFVYSPKHLAGYRGEIPGKTTFTWAWNEPADLRIIDGEVSDDNRFQFLRANFRGEEVQCLIPFTDAASIENAICCWATVLAMGLKPQLADLRMEKLHPVKMRLELKTGINNCSVVDDSYSLDLSSLAIALDFLRQQNQHLNRTLVLSDFPAVGAGGEALYTQIASLLEAKEVDRLVGVGPELSRYAGRFSMGTEFFPDTEALLAKLEEGYLFSDETVLLKGARRFEFERISKVLTQKVHDTVLEINLNALENNLNYYKSQLKPGVKLMAMVKAFSYGSGSFEIANLLQFNRVDYLAVAYADEGVSLRKAGITMPIMVMNPDVSGFDTMIDNDLEPEIYSLRVLRDFRQALHLKGREKYPVHIKLDTGMHRLGFCESDIDALLPELLASPSIRVKSVFSHLTSSEDPAADHHTRAQLEVFTRSTARIEEALRYPLIKHISNTSGISRWPEANFDMVRLGIGLYGIDSAFKDRKSPLETVAVLKTSISQIKELEQGDTVGYNRRGVLAHKGRIATVKIGYADGYSRKLGNGNGKMIVRGKIVPTIGSICMDMCMLDITGIDAKEGDEVIVFNDVITVDSIARQLETIPYEVLTGISQRVKRIYYYE